VLLHYLLDSVECQVTDWNSNDVVVGVDDDDSTQRVVYFCPLIEGSVLVDLSGKAAVAFKLEAVTIV
jgi:hypothetical protein